MRKILCLPLLVILVAVIDLRSQIPTPSTQSEDQRREAERRSEAERELRMRNMREFDTTMKPLTRPKASVPPVPTIDKETSERISLARRIDATDLSRYSEFLKADKTGIFKLFPDHDCVTNNVVRVDGKCENFVMASSSFSFRTGAYVHPYYHDLGFDNDEILSDAFFSQGIIAALGDIPIEEVGQNTDGLKYLFELKPSTDPETARRRAIEFKAGVDFGGFRYARSAVPTENTTYVLRSIAYNVANSLPPASNMTSVSELRFHTLAIDKRADVIIAFRIVRKDANGSLTIVWKELSRTEAPKIKFRKNEKFADFKPERTLTQH